VTAGARPRFSAEYERRSRAALEVALDTVPAYRSWRALDPGSAVALDSRYAALPCLTKAMMRTSLPQGFVPAGRDLVAALARGEVDLVKTSGTTAEQVTNVWNQAWWNASEAASWRLCTHTRHLDHTQTVAELASALSVGFLSRDDLPTERRKLGPFLFLNEKATALEWTDAHPRRMLRELAEFRPVILEANPSLLARLAWWALAHGETPYEPEVILLTYELPSRAHLTAISRAFRAPVCSSHGATEVGYVFAQCEHGRLHQNVESCRVDFEPLAARYGAPGVGRVLVTTFDNPWASIVRFDVGDLVRLEPGQHCPCGRDEGFILEAIEGRAANVTFDASGRVVTTAGVDEAMGAIDGVLDYRLVQRADGACELELVVTDDAPEADRECRAAVGRLYGAGTTALVRRCADVAPGVSGKYRRTSRAEPVDEGGLFA
jgi:phenylacetate-coenzyme A ligase PaaK-like adenylate-forming protein